MSVLRYYVCITYVFGSLRSLACNIRSFFYLSLVLCCDIHRSTLISIMYPACMITVHDRKSRALHMFNVYYYNLDWQPNITWHSFHFRNHDDSQNGKLDLETKVHQMNSMQE